MQLFSASMRSRLTERPRPWNPSRIRDSPERKRRGVAGISGSGSQINVDTSTLVNNNNAFAIASGSNIRVSNNNIYNNGVNFNITAGGAVLSAGNNRTTPDSTRWHLVVGPLPLK